MKLARLARGFYKIASSAAAILQRPLVHRYGRAPLSQQPVFIIGAPRTGSTIFYQALTNYLDVLYIDNLACRWHRSLYFGFWLSRRAFGVGPHDNFEAQHGDTRAFGGHAPSECGDFWYRWLPRDRHFVDADEISGASVEEMRREIVAVTNRWNRPLVFKNLSCGQRLRLLKRCFPNAKFIYIRRDPERVIASILEARARTSTPEGELWSIRPRNYTEIASLPEESMVAAQVDLLGSQIEADLMLFPRENVMEINFNEFSLETIHRVGEFIGASMRPGGRVPSFRRD
jgi:hypothetical protein